ncbi:TPA: hypothetical protein LVN29_002648 [Klebsiella michiganensis]|nr:hypothetical protein [Klebsiella michiganensis]
MRQVPFDVLGHAENALSLNESAVEILSMWMDGIPDGDAYKSEALRVFAVTQLLDKSIKELVKARDSYTNQ